MQISSFLYKKTTYEIIFPPDPDDPSYFLDLKDHLDKNLDYRKHRIEWRKGQPASWDMWRIKEEFFQMFCEKDLPVFHRDIEIFVNYYPDLPTGEIAKIFCGEFKGYEKTYGIEFVERAIRRCKHETNTKI